METSVNLFILKVEHRRPSMYPRILGDAGWLDALRLAVGDLGPPLVLPENLWEGQLLYTPR